MASLNGTSGAVRVQRLSGVGLSAAEAHGKRLDRNGKMRRVRDAEAISTTGLDLNELYGKHIEGAQVHKSHTKAMHIVVQFPKALVGEDEGKWILKHAREFAERVFGNKAIFADRIDRDEKSMHVVDLFIAPRYEKATKRKTTTAISTSKHLKELAAKHKKAPTLRGQGQALQSEWYEYLKKLGLDVERGHTKDRLSPDWLTPEDYAQSVSFRKTMNKANEARETIQKAEELEPQIEKRRSEASKSFEKASQEADRIIAAKTEQIRALQRNRYTLEASIKRQALDAFEAERELLKLEFIEELKQERADLMTFKDEYTKIVDNDFYRTLKLSPEAEKARAIYYEHKSENPEPSLFSKERKANIDFYNKRSEFRKQFNFQPHKGNLKERWEHIITVVERWWEYATKFVSNNSQSDPNVVADYIAPPPSMDKEVKAIHASIQSLDVEIKKEEAIDRELYSTPSSDGMSP